MKKIEVNDTVMFRYKEDHLYGVVLQIQQTEEEDLFTILCGNKKTIQVYRYDILKNYGDLS